MKRTIKVILFAVFFAASNLLNAQATLKLGHIDTQALIAAMPETKIAQTNLEKEAKSLEEAMEIMEVEYRNKLNDYVQKRDSLVALVKSSREQELQELQQRIQGFEQQAQQQLQQKQQELFKPIMAKAKKAIEDVAKENSFYYIFEMSTGAIVYASPESTDILALVKKKLGIL